MSLLIEILQEVEQAEEEDKSANLYPSESKDENKENLEITYSLQDDYPETLRDNHSEKWTNEFLPEFSEVLTQDFSNDNTVETEEHYYDQPLEEFLENAQSNAEISLQDSDIFVNLEEELEIHESDENEESLLLPLFNLNGDEENAIETIKYDEEELIESVKSANVLDSGSDINEETTVPLAKSIKNDTELLSHLSEISAKSTNDHDKYSEIFVEISDNIVDKIDLLKENQYVISAQTLMASHLANRKKQRYALLFLIFLVAGGLISIAYKTFMNLESENAQSSSSLSGNLKWKRPSQQVDSNEKWQKNEPQIETASTKQSPLNTDEKLNVSEKPVEFPIESESGESRISNVMNGEIGEKFEESDKVEAKISPAVESMPEMTKTRFSTPDDNVFQKVAEIDDKTTDEKPEEKEGIKVIRKNKPRYLNDNLSRAYTAFQQGDDENAQIIYNEVLQQEPKNRDALLGLAAISLKKGDSQKALQLYQEVLVYYPQDKVAQVGLMATQSVQMPEETESHLKTLLSQSPTAAFIHFGLANFYAQNNRWAEAQQAYTLAFEYDNQRADYAYNLAVSLEHLQQKQTALYYYQQALQLAQSQATNFDIKITEQRVKTLENSIKSGN
jgi:tetratricopeptide (TPR) repeat protein